MPVYTDGKLSYDYCIMTIAQSILLEGNSHHTHAHMHTHIPVKHNHLIHLITQISAVHSVFDVYASRVDCNWLVKFNTHTQTHTHSTADVHVHDSIPHCRWQWYCMWSSDRHGDRLGWDPKTWYYQLCREYLQPRVLHSALISLCVQTASSTHERLSRSTS